MSNRDPAAPEGSLRFLDGGGEMGERIRAFDWRATPLGLPQAWPQALKTLVNLALASPQPMFLGWGPQKTWLYNDAFIPILGRKHPAALGQPSMAVWAEARDVLEPMFDRVFAGEPVSIADFALELDRAGQLEQAHFEFAYTPARGEDGAVQGLFGACIETTARVLAERRQAEGVARLRRVFDQAPGFIIVMRGPEHGVEFVNRAHRRLFNSRGWRGKPIRAAFPDIAGQGFFEELDAVYATGTPYQASAVPVRFRRRPGDAEALRYLTFTYAPLLDETGQITGIFCEGFDVTETHRLQAELRAVNETLERRVVERTEQLQSTQEALRQSQKLEAMGQLTGGIAHDFNNLLTPIVGGLDILQRRGVGGERERRLIDGAMQSAERARTLVQRLLAFARRQPLQAEVVDIADLVTNMADLVSSTTGPQIRVVVDVPAGLPHALADPNQIEMAILNLSVNARDAMPDGGTITLSAAADAVGEGQRTDLAPGRYVRLSVVDTGTGMDKQTLAHAIEPFFSTKGVGKGTGLGLSMVHGVASQLGGAMTISSALGLGTNVELWLPAVDAPADTHPQASATAARTIGPGVVLLVDDEDLVRASTVDMLTDLGFRVVDAPSAEAALEMIADGLVPTLLVTDHLMPRMTGVELARKVKERLPDLAVLIISGYAEVEGIAADLPRLSKPFRRAELEASIAEIVATFAGKA